MEVPILFVRQFRETKPLAIQGLRRVMVSPWRQTRGKGQVLDNTLADTPDISTYVVT